MQATLQNGKTTLDVSTLPSGIYFIKTKQGTQKFIKQ
jgi:type IX secretion system substrate protein